MRIQTVVEPITEEDRERHRQKLQAISDACAEKACEEAGGTIQHASDWCPVEPVDGFRKVIRLAQPARVAEKAQESWRERMKAKGYPAGRRTDALVSVVGTGI